MQVDSKVTPNARVSRRLGWIVGAIVVVAGVAWWLLRPTAMPVVTVQAQALTRTLQFTARVESRERVDLGVTQTGRVERVLVREGDRVTAGQTLLVLEQQESKAALAQAEASLLQAQARLGSQQGLTLSTAQASLAQAEATWAAAQRDLQRTQELVAQGFFSQSRLDDARRAEQVARAQHDAARAQVQANQQQGPEQRNVLAQRQAAQAAVEVAQARLAQTVVRAPGDGQVLVRSVEPGQIVQAGKALLSVGVNGPIELLASVDERFLAQLQVGQAAKVVADAFPNQPFDAKVTRLAPGVNAQTGAVEVTLGVAAPVPAFLREDMTLSVEVVTGQRPQARVLPLQAVRDIRAGDGGESGTVMVVSEGRAMAQTVRLGLRTLDRVEVVSDLNEGAVVLRDPTVAEGQRVRVEPAAEAAR
jgi:HlyD family secretion protein